MTRPWFTAKDFTRLEITKYESVSDDRVVKSVVLEDPSAIRGLVERIEQIPADGEMMKSFGEDAERTDLAFTGESGIETISIYNGHVKTPSTGFTVTPGEGETALVADIEALLRS